MDDLWVKTGAAINLSLVIKTKESLVNIEWNSDYYFQLDKNTHPSEADEEEENQPAYIFDTDQVNLFFFDKCSHRYLLRSVTVCY